MAKKRQRLLVSVRGPKEALAAAKGGAHIADVEYPASALGTPYPLNIRSVRSRLDAAGYESVPVSTNIGEAQFVRAGACQAALGVAHSGANLIKFGLAEQTLTSGGYLGESLIRTVRKLGPSGIHLFPAVFVDDDMQRYFDPLTMSVALAKETKADGVLVDTFNKLVGKGLLDYWSNEDVGAFVQAMHHIGKQAWIAGSITHEELPELWQTGVDVICVRGAACASETKKGRFAEVSTKIVEELVATIPTGRTKRATTAKRK